LLFIYYKLFKPGGITRVLTNLVNELTVDYDVCLLVLMAEHESFYEIDSRVKIIYIDSFAHWAFSKVNVSIDKYMRWLPGRRNIKNYFYDFGAYRTLAKWLNKNHSNYDTIITCMYKLSSQAAINKEISHKTIAWEHTDHNVGGLLFKNTLRKHYKNLKSVVSINSASYQYYKNLNPNTFLIPNIIGEPFESLMHKIPRQDYITYVGRLDKEKNVIELLEIFKETGLPATWKLQIIGDGPEKGNLENYVQENGLQDSVIFHGSKLIEEIARFLQKSKIFGFTSLKEALPTVLIEAMFAGNALIAYDCKYGPSDIINRSNGFLVPLKDKKRFIEIVKCLALNPLILEKLMSSSYENAQKWKKREIIKTWKEII